MKRVTLQPSFLRARGREPATSARPPVFAKGIISDDTNTTLRAMMA